jgi:molybdopterin-containing oxidoreductase family iron-sulfur binding subunit
MAACPYGVRVFNWGDAERPVDFDHGMVKGRPVGTVEKCTFCVHRINHAKRDEKRSGQPLRDGDIQTACSQVCPTDAIIFGDWKDANSRINRLARDQRNYQVLAELGTEPVVVYLKKVDPSFVEPAAAAH